MYYRWEKNTSVLTGLVWLGGNRLDFMDLNRRVDGRDQIGHGQDGMNHER